MNERLRQAFEAQAARVEPSVDALSTIRGRIHRHRLKRRIAMGLASISSAAVATVTAVLVGVTSCAPTPTPTPPPPGGTQSPGPTSTATSPPPTGGISDTLPVYYLGTARNRVVLYREFHPVTLPDDSVAGRIRAAVAEMLRNDPLDPDYSGAWPAGATVRAVRIEGGAAVVDLGGVATNSVGAEAAAMTIEQLVWTATAVAADANAPIDAVRLLVDGSSRAELWGHVATGGLLRRGEAVSTQAPVWLISPQHGATVGRTFQVHLDGAVFEATANLRVRNASGAIVDERTVTLPIGAPGRGDAFVELTLAPGRYTLEAFYFSPADSSVQGMDDHEIAVS
jgi:hypothetical protein